MKNKKLRKITKVLMSSMTALTMMFITALSASAEAAVSNGNSAAATVLADTSGLIKWIGELGDTARYIGYSISGVAVVIGAIILIGGGNGGMNKVKGIFIGILVGIAILGFGPAIIQDFQAATSTSGMLIIR